MPNISDIIESFILENLGEDSTIVLSRNELASYFSCAPSQINYVLATRFSLDKGYTAESRRGGGGCITLFKISLTRNDYFFSSIYDSIEGGVSYRRAEQILQRLLGEDIINSRERDIILSAISDKAILSPLSEKDKLRANIFKNILCEVFKEE